MPEHFECIVLGAGGFGSSALYHLAKRGINCLGIEAFGIAHSKGSSHGETRVIRKAYFEHPDYVPLCRSAYQLWAELESAAEVSLYEQTGLLLAGPGDGEAVAGARLARERYQVLLEDVPWVEAQERFPGFQLDEAWEVVFESEAGFLHVERCVEVHIEQAIQAGARLNCNERVLSWKSHNGYVSVRTDQAEYHADRLIITAGAWSSQLLAELNIPLTILRKWLFWHEAAADVYSIEHAAPVFFFEREEGAFYGFPSNDGQTLKVAEHTGGTPISEPEAMNGEPSESEIKPVVNFLQTVMPGVQPKPVRSASCMYTNSPDMHFIVDQHPLYRNVVFGAGFSGHGFKFTSVIGKAMAELAIDGSTDYSIGFLNCRREAIQSD